MNNIQLDTFFLKLVADKGETGKFLEAHFGRRSTSRTENKPIDFQIASMLRETADYIEKERHK